MIAMLTPPAGEGGEKPETIPAITTHRHGQGRVVYFAAGIDAANYLYSYPYHRALLRNAITWAASAPPPITVEAPMCVQTALMRQTWEGERLIVHLYNDINTTANRARPEDDIPLREETVPIHDIRVSFRGYHLGSIRLQPEGKELPAVREGDSVTVTVPKLEVHSMVVAELTSTPR
jgi:hypothetical protein